MSRQRTNDEPPLRFLSGSKPFSFLYFPGWTLQEDASTVSLWKTEDGGAITISSILNKDPHHVANAFEHCQRFSEKNGLGPARVIGNNQVAEGFFNTPEGGWCKAKIVASGPRIVIATYNADGTDPDEEQEVDRIMASLGVLKG